MESCRCYYISIRTPFNKQPLYTVTENFAYSLDKVILSITTISACPRYLKGSFVKEGEIPAVLLIIDDIAVRKGAVLAVEVCYYNDEEEKETFPSAADSRKFWIAPKEGQAPCLFLIVQ